MTRRRWMFDDGGDVWLARREAFAHKLGSHMPVEQLHDYAIANLGFISWEDGQTWSHIRLRKSKVSPVALTSLLYALSDRPVGRVVLSVLSVDWEHEIFGDSGKLRARLNEMSVDIFEEDSNRFLSKALKREDLGSREPQAVLHRLWESRKFTAQTMAEACTDVFNGRFTIARVLPTSEMLIEHIGNGYRIYNDNYVDRARGTRHQDEPDSVYGQWVTQTHKDVIRTGKPLLEDVDAKIGASREARRRVRYRRIVLPFTGPSGDSFLVTASTDGNVDLRGGAT